MTRSKKIVSWTAGSLLALLVLLVVLIAAFDWNRLKPMLDRRLSEALGRPFEIHGTLTVNWQRDSAAGGLHALVPWPQFTARDVRIGNPAWAAQRQFAQLEAVRFWLSPWALLAHRIDVPSLQLVHPTVDLERDGDGRANWNFTRPAKAAPSAWTFSLGAIGFDRGQLSLDDAVRKVQLKVAIQPLEKAIPYDQIVAQQSAASTQLLKASGKATGKIAPVPDDADQAQASRTLYQFSWQATGTYRGAPLKGSGKTGAVLPLQQSSVPFPVQADVHIGDIHVALVGTLTDPLHLGALDLKLWLAGSSMARLFPLTGITLPDTPAFATGGHLKGQLQGSGSVYTYRNFRGRVGGSDLAGSLVYDTATPAAGSRPKISGKVTARLLQFSDLAPLIGADSAASKQRRGDTTPQPIDKALPIEPFRTDRWRAMDADVTFSAARIEHGDSLPIDSLSTHLVMDNGVLTLDPLHVGLAQGTAAGSLRLDGSQSPMQGALKLKARHLKLKQLFPTFAPMRTSFGEINGDVTLDARGNSVAALLGSANGELKLLMNDGAISKTLLETVGLNVGNIIIGKLFGDKTVQINCAAADMAARNGLFDMQLFVFDTSDAVINITGNVNLASEQLNLDVMPHTKGARIFSLRSPLYVKGSLKHPDVGVQKGPLLLRGAGMVALAVVAAPAAALLALVSPSHDNDGENTCRNVLGQLRSSGKIISGDKAKSK
jgi:uncharacterized protein involved in outer membrane biogenesis